MEDIFDSATRSTNDFAGVFEFDGEISYFYLYRIDPEHGNKVINSIRIALGEPAFSENDIQILWNQDEKMVGLIIKDALCAVFDVEAEKKYGGEYKLNMKAETPLEVATLFTAH